jgi:hypothetical protein
MTNRTESAPGLGRRLAFAGAVAVGAALAAGELLAGLLGTPSPLLSVARFIVDAQPPGAKDFVVSLFGENDKVAFEVFIILVALAVGAGLGRLAPARPDLAAGILALFAGAGFAAALRDPNNFVVLSAAVAGVEAAAGIWVLRRLVALAVAPSGATSGPDAPTGAFDWRRRSLLQAGGALAVT